MGRVIAVAVLACALLASAVVAVHVQHQRRTLFVELQRLELGVLRRGETVALLGGVREDR